jgi:hypothetical protein
MNYLFDNLIKTNQGKILGLAKNYFKQAIDNGTKDLPKYPLVFEKAWSSIIIEPNNIKIKTDETHIVDHEGIKA